MKFLIIIILILGTLMIGATIIMRKIKRFFSIFTTQPDNINQGNTRQNESVVYDDGKVQVYKGNEKIE